MGVASDLFQAPYLLPRGSCGKKSTTLINGDRMNAKSGDFSKTTPKSRPFPPPTDYITLRVTHSMAVYSYIPSAAVAVVGGGVEGDPIICSLDSVNNVKGNTQYGRCEQHI